MALISKGTTIIGTVIGCKRNYDSRKVNNISLTGTPFVQTPSRPVHRREVSVYCDTLETREALDNASNDGSLLTIDSWLGQELKGYIEKDIRWREKKDGSGVGRFNMLVKEETDL